MGFAESKIGERDYLIPSKYFTPDYGDFEASIRDWTKRYDNLRYSNIRGFDIFNNTQYTPIIEEIQ